MARSQSADFYTIQRSFRQYFQQHSRDRGSGWKQFKRFEHWWEPRLYPSGKWPEAGISWKEIEAFRRNQPHGARDAAQWTELGPNVWKTNTTHWNPGVGRINAIALDPQNPNVIYIGAPAGGIWRSTNNGQSWTPLSDQLPAIGVSAIAIDYTNPNTLYIGTGDKDGFDTYSIGVLKSTDWGASWQSTGLNWTINGTPIVINKLLMHPQNPQILFAASNRGLFRTADGGNNWSTLLTDDIDDIAFKPGQPNTLYAISLTNGTHFLRSTDGGNSFQATGQQSSGRVQLAVTAAAPDYVYYFATDGLFRSTNSGLSFSLRGPCPAQTHQNWYDWAIAVSPTNPEEVHVGAIETYVSFDGGSSFIPTSEWYFPSAAETGYVHADIHVMLFEGNTLYVGSDGLIARTHDSGANWETLTEGLGIRQFYNIGISQSQLGLLIGGAQDNGTSIYNAASGWSGWLGADGFEAIIHPQNPLIMYGTSQNGSFYKTTDGGTSRVAVAQPGSGAWSTPFVMDPVDANTLYVGTAEVRKTTDGMQSWTTIGSFDITQHINELAIAPSNNHHLYASKVNKLWRTTNGGQSWIQLTGLPDNFIRAIAIHPRNPQKIAVCFSGYSQGIKVYMSDNGGNSWVNISENLPNLPANTLVFRDDSLESLYVGMDVGVYVRTNQQSAWQAFFEGLPNVPVTELEIQYLDNSLLAATYGRGLWQTPLPASGPQLPRVSTLPVSQVGAHTAMGGGQVLSDGGTSLIERGLVLSTSPTPTLNGQVFPAGTGTGSFQTQLTGLLEASTYYVRAYATNEVGTAYGNEVVFTTERQARSCGNTNLALNRPVTFSSEENSAQGYFPASNAVDGNPQTRWSSEHGIDPQWIYVDLGREIDICKVVVKWEAAYAADFSILLWNANTSNWDIVHSITGNTQLTNTIENLQVRGRYISVYGTQRATPYGYSIYEFEVYGEDSVANQPPVGQNVAFSLPENSATGTYVGTVPGRDPEGASLQYQILAGNLQQAFALHPQTGVLTVQYAPALDYETHPSFELLVRISDGALADTLTAAITLTDLYEHQPCTENLAQNRPVVVSSVENNQTDLYGGHLAVDGDEQTYWSSLYADPQWLYVDLGQEVELCRLALKWGSNYARNFFILVWTGTTWQHIRSVVNNQQGTHSLENLNASARYVAIFADARAGRQGYQLAEFEVYGTVLSTAMSHQHAPPAFPPSLASVAELNLYPLPADEQLQVEFQTPIARNIELQLIDMKGGLHISRKMAFEAGLTTFTLPTATLPAGAYLLIAGLKSGSISKRFLVIH